MKCLPILFSGPMVRAILDGLKTQTRRVIKPQPPMGCRYVINGAHAHALCMAEVDGHTLLVPPTPTSIDHRMACPYGKPGDRLWVRETCWIWGKWTRNGLTKTGRQKWRFKLLGKSGTYDKPTTNPAKREAAPGQDGAQGWAYRHARYMPRWASRITLEVTSIRVERLQAITEEDAIAEGARQWETIPEGMHSARYTFANLWQSINGARPGCSWDDNPWVWVIGFRRFQ